MKFRHFLFAALAAMFSFTACQEEEQLGAASIIVDPVSMEFTAVEGSQTVSLTATRDWWISSKPEWVAIDVEKGTASSKAQNVTVSVEKNEGFDREGDVVFTIGLAKTKLKLVQAGEKGKYEVPTITCAEFIEKADPSTEYRLKGVVTSAVNTSYCSFDMNDGTATVTVWTVNNKDEWKDVVKKGGTVTVRGKYTLYENNGTQKHEMVDAYIEEFEAAEAGTAKGDGSLENPYNPAGAAAYAESLGADVQSDKSVYIKGKISEVSTTYEASGTYGNATFTIVDAEDGTGSFYIFQTLYLGNRKWKSGDTDVKADDEVIVFGPVVNFKGNTPETVGKGASYLYSLNGDTGSDTPAPQPGDIKAVTVEEFIDAEESSTQQYELVGTIGGTINTTYGNFDLTDETGTVYVYGLTATDLGYGAKNDKSYSSLGLNEGDKIKIVGYRGSYGDKIEVVYAYFVEKISGGENPNPQPGDIKAVTVEEFNAAEESSTQKYELTGTIGGTINTTYGNFDLTDETGTVYVYGLTATDLGYGAKNDKSYSSLGLNEGDKIKIVGYRGSYGDKIEVVYAYFVEKISGGENPNPQPGGDGDFNSNVTWASGSNQAYSEKATVNGVSDVEVLKLGTGTKTGSSTLTLPEGSTRLTFYALSWNGKPSKLVFKIDGEEVASVEPAANTGLANTAPYTLTVTDSDKYTITFSATSTLDVETSGSNTRVAMFGVIAE